MAYYRISEVLSQVKQNTEPFGNINVIFAGDFCQLPPVGDTILYSNLKKNWTATDKGQKTVLGKLLWLSVNIVVILTQPMRQSGPENDTFEDRAVRHVDIAQPDWNNPECTVPLIVPGNVAKNSLNAQFAVAFASTIGKPLHWYHAQDK
ncbi:hypothetical protein K435DRAFT_649087 [Dendrothele bispora CBS 962.96]|uniref:ATP-dependent DNA helicase n=1 Tax=Dendrothele bispora (strain CBS 962.96) TaxID=1314807 RepID=A0A4S8MPL5_DENBC|nr:hypothetical protein K435DRAFT_649087 [Dendrothele bispora CBS 962.96]